MNVNLANQAEDHDQEAEAEVAVITHPVNVPIPEIVIVNVIADRTNSLRTYFKQDTFFTFSISLSERFV